VSPESLHLIDRCASAAVSRLETVRSPTSQLSPATVLRVDTPSNLRTILAQFSADKEFNQRFLETIVFAVHDGVPLDIDILEDVLSDIHCKSVYIVRSTTIPEGPYFVQEQSLYRTWRLFPDIYEAFQLPTVQGVDSDKLSSS